MKQSAVSPAAKKATRQPLPSPHVPDEVRLDPDSAWDDEARYEMIAENAYYRAERRGFQSGYELEDWYAAEQEIDALMRKD